MSRLLIVHPYVPAYRVSFFRGLHDELADSDIDLKVVSGRPQGAARLRDDEAGEGVVDSYLRERALSVAGASLNVRFVADVVKTYRPDRIIVEQAVKNLETYSLLAKSNLGHGARVAMWGQGRTFSTSQGRAIGSFKNWLTRRSSWFFAYTQEGADYVVGHGFPPLRVTVLNNTVDTDELDRHLQSVSSAEIERFRREHGLTPGQTALFLGGVDPDKGIEFLLAAAAQVQVHMPGFRLLVAGAGSSSDLVRRKQSEGGPFVYLGRLDGQVKALALQAADLMMIPQWVGLVAVDSLVSGRPIVTTQHPSHSPEFGYLSNDRNAVVCAHDAESYGAAVASLLRDPGRLGRLQDQARRDSMDYSLAGMIDRFAGGVRNWTAAS